jgi:hypothetical protein
MASKKSNKAVASDVNIPLLSQIKVGNVTHISRADGEPLLKHNPPLITVDTSDMDLNQNAAVRLTEAGVNMVPNASAPVTNGLSHKFPIISGFVQPPAKKRGKVGGAPTQYPFAELQVGGSFFVPNTDEMPNALKTMGSTVSSKNMHYSEETGETEVVTRAKRGKKNKAVLDANGEKVMETVTVHKRKPLRKFEIRGVEAGKTYGDWACEQSGAVITRVL